MLQTGSKRRYSTRSSHRGVENKTFPSAEKSPAQPIENEELECAICTDEYKNPKLLHCMHTFCGGCIEQLQEHGNEENVICPKCRFVTKVGEDGNLHLLRNHIIEQKVKGHQASLKRKEKTWQCGDCTSESTTDVCTTCNLKLCNFCAEYHKRSVRFKDHEIRSIGDASNEELLEKQPIQCSMHKQELKYFCETCKILICVECILCKRHHRHVFSSVDKVMERELESLKNSIVDADNTCQEYEAYYEKVVQFQSKSVKDGDASRKLVEDTFAVMHRVLQSEKKKLLDWLTEKNDSSVGSVNNAKVKVNHLKNLTNYMKEVLEYPAAEVFDVISGATPLQETTRCMESVIKDRANVSSAVVYMPLTTDATVEGNNDFDVQLISRRIERSEPLMMIERQLRAVRDNFALKESRFPPPGVCSLTVKNVSQFSGHVLGQQITHKDCLWSLKAKRLRGPRDPRDLNGGHFANLGMYLRCEPKEYSISWSCSAHGKLILKSHSGDNDFSVGFTNQDFCNGDLMQRIYVWPWKWLTDKNRGYLKDDSVTFSAQILVDEQ